MCFLSNTTHGKSEYKLNPKEDTIDEFGLEYLKSIYIGSTSGLMMTNLKVVPYGYDCTSRPWFQ